MRRYGAIALALLLALPLGGCWNRTELNELGITSATGVDRKDGKWIVTYQVVVPSAMWSGTGGSGAGLGSQSPVHVFASEGQTMREAMGNAYRSFSRRLYFSHTDVLVVGRQAAEEGIADVLDLYLRSFDSRETVLLAVADGPAEEILRQLVPPERLPGNALSKILMREQNYSGMVPAVRVFDLAKSLYSDAKALGVPEVVLKRTNSDGRQSLKSMDAFKATSKSAELQLRRIGAFREDRLVGWLNDRESYGISLLKNEVRNSVISFPCPGSDDGAERSSLQIQRAKTRIVPQIRDGERLSMRVRVNVKGDLMESSCQGDLASPAFIESLERQAERKIAQEIETGWQAARRLRLDLPGFADRVHRKYPTRWRSWKEDWDDRLTRVELDVRVKASIRHVGLAEKTMRQKVQR